MKRWEDIKQEYSKYVEDRTEKSSRQRLVAIKKIEVFVHSNYPSLLGGYVLFKQISKIELKGKFINLQF